MFDIDDNNSVSGGAKIKVIGVGGGGCNAVNTMIRSGLTGVEYIVANTDSQALNASLAQVKIQLGGNITKGLGAGANPEVGRKAAMEDFEKISEVLHGADMVFVTAGMGGGTGTGAAPVIAKLARELGALTVGVVTKPFMFEGKRRSRQAEEGIRNLEDSVDSLICIPNQRLLQLAGENLSLVDTFRSADEVLLNAVQGISDLINNTGLINADFADVATVMTNKGLSLMGTGSAVGEDRALKAATLAISSPLLEDVSVQGATGIIINITGNSSLKTHETNQAVSLIMEAADEDAEIIFGTVIDESMGETLKVTVIATGLQTARKEININQMNEEKVSGQSSHQTMIQAEAARVPQEMPRMEVQSSTPVNRNTDYAVKSEMMFELEDKVTATPVQDSHSRSKINWAEKLQSAANRYESQKSQDSANVSSQTVSASPKPTYSSERSQELTQSETEHHSSTITQQAAQNRESRIKSIAEKLGFFNFDEDEFDTPSFMKKNERNHDSQI